MSSPYCLDRWSKESSHVYFRFTPKSGVGGLLFEANPKSVNPFQNGGVQKTIGSDCWDFNYQRVTTGTRQSLESRELVHKTAQIQLHTAVADQKVDKIGL